MIVSNIVAPGNGAGRWMLVGPCGETMHLPHCTSGIVRIGLVGTRAQAVKSAKTKAFADMLDALNCPVILVDARRSGSGGNGAWGPLEFSTKIPGMMNNGQSYSFHHLPLLAPALDLLASYRKANRIEASLKPDEIEMYATGLSDGSIRDDDVPEYAWKHWQIFKVSYKRDLTPAAILAARAFAEAASVSGGIGIFLCAEEFLPGFDEASASEQDEFYCHRYTLAAAVARSIANDDRKVAVERNSLHLGRPPQVSTWDGSAFL